MSPQLDLLLSRCVPDWCIYKDVYFIRTASSANREHQKITKIGPSEMHMMSWRRHKLDNTQIGFQEPGFHLSHQDSTTATLHLTP